MEPSKNNLLTSPVLPSLLRFAVPVLLALLLQALYGAVDLWAVGVFGSTADISAVSTGSQTLMIVTGAIAGLSMGSTILLGRRVGRRDSEGSGQVVGSSVKLFCLLGTVLSVVMVFAAEPIARVMNAPDEALKQTTGYIRICGGGSLFIAAYNLLSAIFRGTGDSKSPLVFVSIACVVNIAGDIVLINGFNLGAEGAAIATVAAQAVSVALSLVFIKKKGLPFPIGKRHFTRHNATTGMILKLGSPIALQDMCNEISYLIILGLVNALGVAASAGVGIAEKLVIFILLIPMAYMQSVSAFVSQNVGAGKYERANRAMWTGMQTAALLGGVLGYAAYFHGDALSTIFVKDAGASQADVIRASAEFLRATSIECFLLSIACCLTGYFNGLGKTTFVMAQGLAAVFLVKIPYAYAASRAETPSLFNIGLSMAYAALFTLTICLIYYARTRRRGGAPVGKGEVEREAE